MRQKTELYGKPEWVVWFTQNRRGRVDKLHIGAWGMRDMPFERVKK